MRRKKPFLGVNVSSEEKRDTAMAELVMIYEGSDGEATRGLYARLAKLGPAGTIAVNLFRACKCSVRAKAYRQIENPAKEKAA